MCGLNIGFVVVAITIVAAEAKHNRGADEGIFFANFTLEEAFPGPVEQAEIAAVNDEPWWTNVSLDDVFGLGVGILEAGRWMFDDGFAKNFVELGGLYFEMASLVDFGGELEKFGDILAGLGASDEDGCVR